MDTFRKALEEQLAQLPALPFFARLRDPRQRLSDLQRAKNPHLAYYRAFVVTQACIDHDPAMPGVWLKAVDTTPVLTVLRPGEHGLVGHDFKGATLTKHRHDLWLNLEWCVLLSASPLTPHHYAVN